MFSARGRGRSHSIIVSMPSTDAISSGGSPATDVALAETFLHHRVLAVPVVSAGRPRGVVTRTAFFRRLADRFLERT
jgi:CBS domain-containing protein